MHTERVSLFMKNGAKIYKKIILCMLSVILVLGSAACSKENTPDGSKNTEEKNNMETVMQPSAVTDAEYAARYIYSNTFIDFKEYGDDVIIHDIAGKGDQLYVLM